MRLACCALAIAAIQSPGPAASGLDALRTLQAGRGEGAASRRLGYAEGRHPREAALRARGLARTDWGWIPAAMLRDRRSMTVPEGDVWVDERASDAAHSTWRTARTLAFTFTEIASDLPIAESAALGRDLDGFLEWIRALFCGQPGFREPEWPLRVKASTRAADFAAESRTAGPDAPELAGLCLYPTGTCVLVNAAAAKELPEGLAGVARHETAHAFLWCAFHRPDAAVPASAWIVEAFPVWCGLAAPETGSPADVGGRLRRKPKAREAIERIARGDDVMAELEAAPFEEAVRHPQAFAAGPLFVADAMKDPVRLESIVALAAAVHAGACKAGDFTRAFGPTAECSRRLRGP